MGSWGVTERGHLPVNPTERVTQRSLATGHNGQRLMRFAVLSALTNPWCLTQRQGGSLPSLGASYEL